jgi:hypothetical protein
MKNYGIDLEKQKADESVDDWRGINGQIENHPLGAVALPDIAIEVNGLVVAGYAWPEPVANIYHRVANAINHCFAMFKDGFEQYLPKGEVQNNGGEKMDCVTRGHHNKIEEKLNFAFLNNRLSETSLKFFTDNGYIVDGKFALNDRITAILSGTGPTGNSIKAPIDTTRKIGIFPKNIINQYGLTFNEYYDRTDITQKVLDMGLESLKYISISYLTVSLSNFDNFVGAIKYLIFDNYIAEEKEGSNYIKQLAPDYNLYPIGYEIIINDLGKKKLIIENDMQTLYKAKGSPKVYMLGLGDGLYHWIVDEPVFSGLFDGFDKVKLVELDSIADSQIGFTIYDKQSLLSTILGLFNSLKGRK